MSNRFIFVLLVLCSIKHIGNYSRLFMGLTGCSVLMDHDPATVPFSLQHSDHVCDIKKSWVRDVSADQRLIKTSLQSC